METKTTMESIPSEKHYYGVASFIEKNKKKDLTIFIIDDNEAYLHLLKQILDYESFSVFTFTTGEEALEYIEIKPDLVLIDFHLNSIDTTALNGDRIAELFKQRVPGVEIALISADKKINLISELNNVNFKNIIYKDEKTIGKIIDVSDTLAEKKSKKLNYFIPFIVLLSFTIIENLILIIKLWN
ncbi:MAG: Chemotaxis protein CheY [Bacteroidota bacterium]|jgi:CheY-like chemotaxis protein